MTHDGDTLERRGYCVGCGDLDVVLHRVAWARYRCETCAAQDDTPVRPLDLPPLRSLLGRHALRAYLEGHRCAM